VLEAEQQGKLGRGAVRELAMFQWGLIPSWSKEPKGFINARAETLPDKPSFSESFQRRRCLIPADGFYEEALRTFETTLLFPDEG
jgi:putative SOS response-associated peptidase YedK